MSSNLVTTQPYKGTRDFYPAEMRLRRWMFNQLRRTVESYGYEEYDGPMLESFDLYAAKTGEEIVDKQLYSFIDRGDRKVAMRPEMTPTFARMVAAKLNEIPRPIRWYSIPNLWRYERPQRGRLREHWQLNVDVMGGDPLLADAEILEVAFSLLDAFKGGEHLEIRINHRQLMDRFFNDVLHLTPEAALACTKAIDAKDKISAEAFDAKLLEIGLNTEQKAALLQFFNSPLAEVAQQFGGPGADHLTELFKLLARTRIGSRLRFDPSVLRGMDYYTGMVFEIYDTSPENRRALFGGGRYDNLLGIFGKESVSGVGFGMGDVGLQNFLETHGLVQAEPTSPRIYLGVMDRTQIEAFSVVEERLRQAKLTVLKGLQIGGGMGAQLKTASRLGAGFAILWGETERAQDLWIIKDLAKGTQATLPLDELADWIRSR